MVAEAEDERTAELIAKWKGADVQSIRTGRSAEYLRETGQVHDHLGGNLFVLRKDRPVISCVLA